MKSERVIGVATDTTRTTRCYNNESKAQVGVEPGPAKTSLSIEHEQPRVFRNFHQMFFIIEHLSLYIFIKTLIT